MLARLHFHSLRGRLLGGTILVIVVVMAAVTVVVERRQRAATEDELRERGLALARSVAAMSEAPLLLYNYAALEQNVARLALGAGVSYAIVLDADGRVAAHSARPEGIGRTLEGTVHDRALAARTPLVQRTVTDVSREPVVDFAVPIQVGEQRWGTVRVGLSTRQMEAEIVRTRWELGALAGAALLFGGVAAALVARRLAQPVQALERGAAAIALGDLGQRIEPSTTDEIGRLGTAFNSMAGRLEQQREALEAAHRELAERFAELSDLKTYTDTVQRSLTSGVVTVDLAGRIVMLNPAAEGLTGVRQADAAGQPGAEVFAAAPELARLLTETLATRHGVANVTFTLRQPGGPGVPVELHTAPLKAGDGRDLGAVGVFWDLTALRELEARLRRSDRLAAIGTLAAGVAHEIKNPLAALVTFTNAVGRKFDDAAFRQRFLTVVPRELERINEIVERLLELAHPPRLKVAPVRLPWLLDRVLDLYAERLESGRIVVARQYAPGLAPVQADGEALYRSVVNLVGNAVDAMEEGGTLTLRLLRSDDSAPGPNRVGDMRGRVVIEVEDTGRGIAPADAERVFSLFFTTKQKGTGLGLALTHKIVEDHGGSLDFRSEPGVGTTFRLALPLIADLPAMVEHEAAQL